MTVISAGLLHWHVRCDGCGITRALPSAGDYLAESHRWLMSQVSAMGWEARQRGQYCPRCSTTTKEPSTP